MKVIVSISLAAFLALLGACEMGPGPGSDAGTEPDPEPDLELPCDDGGIVWPEISPERYHLFEQSNCTEIGSLVMGPDDFDALDNELSALTAVEEIVLRGDFPSETTFEELGDLEIRRGVRASGSGIRSFAGLANQITTLSSGIQISNAPDFIGFGLPNLVSIGQPDESPNSSSIGLQLINLPSLASLDLPTEFEFVSGPLVLEDLPNLPEEDVEHLIDLILEVPLDLRGEEFANYCGLNIDTAPPCEE